MSDNLRERSHDGTEHESSDATGATPRLPRRTFVRSAAAAGVGGLALGSSGAATAHEHAAVAEQDCSEQGDQSWTRLDVNDAFQVMNNKWDNASAYQCVYTYQDGSCGWEFRDGASNINYPEVFIGERPWAEDTGVSEFQDLQRGDVDELIMDWETTLDLPRNQNQEWNLAMEWWLLDGEPDAEDPPDTHEIMLVLDHSDAHDHGGYVERSAWTDEFGNTVHHWGDDVAGGTGARFHVFVLDELSESGTVDLGEIVDYLTEEYGVRQDLNFTGIELGTEYWGDTSGQVTIHNFNVTINGTTYECGDGTFERGGESQAPPAPTGLSTSGVTTTEIELAWSAVDEAQQYTVSLDGEEVDSTSSTSYTFDGLDPDTQYTVGVQSENADGTSDTETTTVRTDEEDGGPCADVESMQVDGQRVCNVDGDEYYRDVNGDGNVGNRDVGAFFENFHFDAFDRDEFDYSGNGRVSHGDVVALFDSVV